MRKKGLLAMSIILIMAMITACSSNAGSKPEASNTTTETNKTEDKKEGSSDPITLKVLRAGITVTETEFQKILVEPTKKKFPNITLEWVDAPEDVELEPLITSGAVPDIIFTGTAFLPTTYKDLDLVENL